MKQTKQFSRSQKIATKIVKHVGLWMENTERIIIGIEGYSASGKTTVADCLAKDDSRIVVIHLDDLLKSSEDRVAMMTSDEDRSKVFELKWYRYDLLNSIVEKFKQSEQYSVEIYDYDLKKTITKVYDLAKPILIIEGIFLFHPEHTISKAFNRKVYLAVDFDKADGRRNRREKNRWGKDYVDESHPDSFIKPFKEAYRRYFNSHHPDKLADLVIKIV